MPRYFSILVSTLAVWAATTSAHASNYGYSFNINFAANGDPITGPAGKFSEATWNNFSELNSQGPRRLVVDSYGKPGQVAPIVTWDAKSLGILPNIRPQNPNDGRLIRCFLDTPTNEWTNLYQFTSPNAGQLN